MMQKWWHRILNTSYTVWVVGTSLVLFTTTRQFLLGNNVFDHGEVYTFYNNYLIFKNSFLFFIQGANPYIDHPEFYFDLFKYSPPFCVFMAPFGILPDYLGLLLWNSLNIFPYCLALVLLGRLLHQPTAWMMLFTVQELFVATINSQSNTLIAALLLLSFVLSRQSKPGWAALLISLAFIIKPFAILGFVLFLFDHHRWKFFGYSILFMVALHMLPFLLLGVDGGIRIYLQWFDSLQQDYAASYGISVMGMAHKIFGLGYAKNGIVLIGALLLLFPWCMYRYWSSVTQQFLVLSMLLIWVVLFNHKAESPSYILAALGVAVWFEMSAKNGWAYALMIFVFLFSMMSSSDIFPLGKEAQRWWNSYELKALPCMVVWVVAWVQSVSPKKELRHG